MVPKTILPKTILPETPCPNAQNSLPSLQPMTNAIAVGHAVQQRAPAIDMAEPSALSGFKENKENIILGK